jgi:hypothetical protein
VLQESLVGAMDEVQVGEAERVDGVEQRRVATSCMSCSVM